METTTMRLFCFHGAGVGASSFSAWAAGLPAAIEVCPVQLPGREERLRERPLESMAEAVELLLGELAPRMDRPFAFFGHGMGALVAYELALQLRREGRPGPRHLFVCGHAAPHLPRVHGPLEGCSTDELVATVTRLGGIPQAFLREPAFLIPVIRAIRADLRLCGGYRFKAPSRRLACPITAFCGRTDPQAGPAQVRHWRMQTRGSFGLRVVRGGHQLLRLAQEALLGEIEACLLPARAARAAG